MYDWSIYQDSLLWIPEQMNNVKYLRIYFAALLLVTNEFMFIYTHIGLEYFLNYFELLCLLSTSF